MNKNIIIPLMVGLLTLSACDNSVQQAAETLLNEAGQHFTDGDYDVALAKIDSLRKLYPNAVETRRKALALYQSISLKQAQDDLAHTDSILQVVTHDYN